MKCPFDGAPMRVPSIKCVYCSGTFTGADVMEVAKTDYLLAELDTWGELLPGGILSQLRRRYVERKDLLLGQIQALATEGTDPSSPGR